ncbi:MAG: hypothetical protein AB7E55_26190 [Pigmentiphaga sp.]
MGDEQKPVHSIEIGYTNWRGEYSVRHIRPEQVWYGSTEWHPERQWFLRAIDVDKFAVRDFALKDIGRHPASELVKTASDPEWIARAAVSIAAMTWEWHLTGSTARMPADLIARRLERFVPADLVSHETPVSHPQASLSGADVSQASSDDRVRELEAALDAIAREAVRARGAQSYRDFARFVVRAIQRLAKREGE